MTDEHEVLYVDRVLNNADWPKRTWDLPTEPEMFLEVIGGRKRLQHFLTLPAAKAMPADLRAALGV